MELFDRGPKLLKKYIFFLFLSFWVKHDSCDVYLKYGLVQNRLCERHFLIKFWSEVVFRKDDFEKYKNFVRNRLS